MSRQLYYRDSGYGHNYGYKPVKERSGCLWILLALGTIGGILSVFRGCSMPATDEMSVLSEILGDLPQWYFLANGIINFCWLICLVGIWFWQKWGWFGMVSLTVIGLFISMAAGMPILFLLIGNAISLGIWWAVLSSHWDNFE